MIESFLEPVESKYNDSRVDDEDITDGCEEKDADLDIKFPSPTMTGDRPVAMYSVD
jgi:hypothetical protein